MDTERSNGFGRGFPNLPSIEKSSPSLLPAPIGLTDSSPALLALLQDMEEAIGEMLHHSNQLVTAFDEAESEAQIAIRMVEIKRRTAETQRQAHRTVKQSGVGPLLSLLCPGQHEFPARLEALNDVKTTFYKRRNARYVLLRLHFRLVREQPCDLPSDLMFEVQLFKSTYPHERVMWTRRSKV